MTKEQRIETLLKVVSEALTPEQLQEMSDDEHDLMMDLLWRAGEREGFETLTPVRAKGFRDIVRNHL